MSTSSIRWMILLALAAVAGIVVTQVFWFRKAFDVREVQFNYQVNAALKEVGEQLTVLNQSPPLEVNPVNQVSGNYFVVRVNDTIDANLLEDLLVNEFRARDLNNNFEYGIYDCTYDKMVYGNFINLSGDKPRQQSKLPKWDNDSYYFGVYFPQKRWSLLGEMNIWIFSSAVLLIVIFFFTYAMLVILRQRRLSQIQTDFINNMTHEFKTPISTISLSSGVLKDTELSPERQKRYSGIIAEESQRLQQHVERLLTVAKLDRNRLLLELDDQDLHELIREARNRVEPLLEEKGGTLICELNASDTLVRADRHHLTNVIFNLLENGIKYSGEQPPALTIETRNEHSQLIMKICDQGIGIPAAFQKKIFEKFYRVPTGDRHDVKGFGLGLHYVKKNYSFASHHVL